MAFAIQSSLLRARRVSSQVPVPLLLALTSFPFLFMNVHLRSSAWSPSFSVLAVFVLFRSHSCCPPSLFALPVIALFPSRFCLYTPFFQYPRPASTLVFQAVRLNFNYFLPLGLFNLFMFMPDLLVLMSTRLMVQSMVLSDLCRLWVQYHPLPCPFRCAMRCCDHRCCHRWV